MGHAISCHNYFIGKHFACPGHDMPMQCQVKFSAPKVVPLETMTRMSGRKQICSELIDKQIITFIIRKQKGIYSETSRTFSCINLDKGFVLDVGVR